MSLLLSLQNYCGKMNFAGSTHLRCVPVEWVESYPEFATDGHNFSTSIELKPGKIWLILPCASDSIDFKDGNRNTKHGKLCQPIASGFIPDDTPNIAAVLNTMSASKWIVIVTYKTGESKVIGSLDAPALYDSSFANSQSLTGSKGYQISFKGESPAKSFFLEAPAQVDPCAPVIINMNGQEMLSAASGATVDFNLLDAEGNPVYITGVDGVDITVEGGQSTEWKRNPDWLPMPEVSPGDNVFYGLFAVYEDTPSYATVQIGGGFADVIDWGDGTTQPYSNLTILTKLYDYSTINSIVLQDINGRNYKQVMISAPIGGNTGLLIEVNDPSIINSSRITNWLDISIDGASLTTIIFSSRRTAPYLERVRIYNNNAGVTTCQYMSSIRVFDWNIDNWTSYQSIFIGSTSDFRYSNGEPISINNTVATNFNSTFQTCGLTEIGDISVTNASLAISSFSSSQSLRKRGTLNLPVCTNISTLSINCWNLIEQGVITTSSSLLNISSAWQGCRLLKEIELTECVSVTNTTNSFLQCYSLERLILPNITVGFNVTDCALDADGLLEMANSVGIASGSQTITTVRCPGAGDAAYIAVLNGKGYTVVNA